MANNSKKTHSFGASNIDDDDDYSEDPTGQTWTSTHKKGIRIVLRNKQNNNGHTYNRKSLGFSTWNQHMKDAAQATVCHAAVRATKLFASGEEKWEDLGDIRALTVEDEDDVYTEIPGDVTSFKNLETLGFSWSNIKSIPPKVFQLPLTELRLERDNLQQINGIGQAKSLILLDLTCNHLQHLPEEIGRLESLRILCVKGNKLKCLPQSIGQLKNLEELDCYSNALHQLPDNICNAKSLKVLDVSRNKLKKLPENIGGLCSLVDIRASNNLIGDLPLSAGLLSSLKSLTLGNNKFKAVPRILGDLSKLECVNFRNNEVKEFQCIVENLKILLLCFNKLYEFPTAIYSCTKLELLSLEGNYIVDDDFNADIQKLKSLRILNLDNNDICTLPDEICQLTELRHLTLQDTDVTDLPDHFDNLTNLTNLVMETDALVDPLAQAWRTNGLEGVWEYVRSKRGEDEESSGGPLYANA